MRNNLSIEEADALLTKLIAITNKNSKKYKCLLNYCIKKFDYIVINKAKKYKQFSNYEDLLQDGRIGLVMAIKSYNPDKGSFYYWANQYVKTQICRKANKHSLINVPIKKAKEINLFNISLIPSLIEESYSLMDSIEEKELKNNIRDIVSKLPLKQRKIIEMYFGMNKEDFAIYKICKELKISKKEFDILYSNATEFLRESLNI